MSTLEVILLCVVVAGAGFAVVKWAFQKDTEVENRRRGAANLATTLSKNGLKKIPEFLIDYSVGDYSGMANKIAGLAKLFLEGEAAVVAEFGEVFENVLKAKLSTETGRAFVAAKLADAVQEGDASAIQNAPVAGVK